MRPNVEQMIRAAVALQVAALEFDGDDSGTQCEARQSVIGMRAAMNSAQEALGLMTRAIEQRRQAAKAASPCSPERPARA